jgi:hypothetical protein
MMHLQNLPVDQNLLAPGRLPTLEKAWIRFLLGVLDSLRK